MNRNYGLGVDWVKGTATASFGDDRLPMDSLDPLNPIRT